MKSQVPLKRIQGMTLVTVARIKKVIKDRTSQETNMREKMEM